MNVNFLRNVANDLLDWTESCHRREHLKSHVIFDFLFLIFFSIFWQFESLVTLLITWFDASAAV